jgi:hypothetical protein
MASRKNIKDATAPPINEYALIGAVLTSAPDAVAAAQSEGISAASFTDQWCADAWTAAEQIIAAGGIADMITVLTAAGLDDSMDRAAEMTAACATVEYAAHYARAVKLDQARRDIRTAAMMAIEQADSGYEVAAILEKVRRDIEAIEDQSRRAPILPAGKFADESLPEPPQVIYGIIRAGQVGMMAASSKAGKSWALLSMAMAVATGGDWMGWKTTKGRVLYINGELSRYDMQRRLKQLAFVLGLPGVPSNLDMWHMRGENKTIAQLIPEIMRRQRSAGKYALILPDPLYCFGGGRDENDNAEQAKTMGEMSEMAERTGAAVFVAHHFSKGNKRDTDHLDRASGAGMFARAVDTFMTFTRHEEEGAYTVETTTRSFAKPDKFVVRWEYPLWSMATDLDPDELKKPNKGGRPAKYSVEKLVEVISKGGMSSGEIYQAYRNESGISERHFKNLLRDAKTRNMIIEQENGWVRA